MRGGGRANGRMDGRDGRLHCSRVDLLALLRDLHVAVGQDELAHCKEKRKKEDAHTYACDD